MPKVELIAGTSTNVNVGGNVNRWVDAVNGGIDTNSSTRTNDVNNGITTGGTWGGLSIYVTGNALTSGSVTVQSCINGTVGNQTVTITNGESTPRWYRDTSHTDSFSAGDILEYKITGNGSSHNIGYAGFNSWINTSTSVAQMMSGGYQTLAPGGDPNFFPLSGSVTYTNNISEAPAEMKPGGTFTVKRLEAGMVAYSISGGNAQLTLRKNGADETAFQITWTGTGWGYDNTGSVDITSSDTACLKHSNSGTGTGSRVGHMITQVENSNSQTWLGTGQGSGYNFVSGRYSQPTVMYANATAATEESYVDFDCTASWMNVNCASYTSGTATFTLMDDGSATNLAVSVTGTGWATDTGTDTIASGSKIRIDSSGSYTATFYAWDVGITAAAEAGGFPYSFGVVAG